MVISHFPCTVSDHTWWEWPSTPSIFPWHFAYCSVIKLCLSEFARLWITPRVWPCPVSFIWKSHQGLLSTHLIRTLSSIYTVDSPYFLNPFLLVTARSPPCLSFPRPVMVPASVSFWLRWMIPQGVTQSWLRHWMWQSCPQSQPFEHLCSIYFSSWFVCLFVFLSHPFLWL